MSAAQWVEYGQILRRVHEAAVPSDFAALMPRETFEPPGASVVRDLDAYVDQTVSVRPGEARLAAFWREHRPAIHRLLATAEQLAQMVARQDLPCVLCHADIHTANVLAGADGRLWIVDWDETVLAPKERDLMFVAGRGISDALVGPEDEGFFFQGYGPTALDPAALAYYRYAWAISDISANGTDVVLRPELSTAARETATDDFMSLFGPGEIVARALASA
ncbi:MAG TPA: phosphotransferase [Chloroflexota bacterium]|nr:phosphotransferase [Chloroflexota bacterium]